MENFALQLLCDAALAEVWRTEVLQNDAVTRSNSLTQPAPTKISSLPSTSITPKTATSCMRTLDLAGLGFPAVQLHTPSQDEGESTFPQATAESSEPGYPARLPSSAGVKKARRFRKEMDKNSPPKRSRADISYGKLLAINEVNPFQFPLGPAYNQAWKNALQLFMKSDNQPFMDTTKELQETNGHEMHNMQCLVTTNIRQFRKRHPKVPPSGILKLAL
ncbi:hypothetical protein RvY_14419 [Ramazzottius varieornatus]|uniref:Uncharacterized protein n=1 Tax=Ramazzottius varieornatus TaxID=947166 RepID=A0A1D1VT84_RAMVA|nr:hypothetical protein RvY_14419 [Ramazzottius varieornatus]